MCVSFSVTPVRVQREVRTVRTVPTYCVSRGFPARARSSQKASTDSSTTTLPKTPRGNPTSRASSLGAEAAPTAPRVLQRLYRNASRILPARLERSRESKGATHAIRRLLRILLLQSYYFGVCFSVFFSINMFLSSAQQNRGEVARATTSQGAVVVGVFFLMKKNDARGASAGRGELESVATPSRDAF